MIVDLLNSSEIPLTAEDIYMQLKTKNVAIWASTVYRTLTILQEKNLIIKDNINGKMFYHINRFEHKHNLVCVGCNKVVVIDECPFNDLALSISKRTGFEVTDHKIEMYGLCPNCKKFKHE